MAGLDRDQALTVFVDSLGEGADVDFARQVLEAHDWDLQAALEVVVGGGGPTGAAAPTHGAYPPDFDEEGYRAPMRTGYTDNLLGPSPEDDVFARAADIVAQERERERVLARAERAQQRSHRTGGGSNAGRASPLRPHDSSGVGASAARNSVGADAAADATEDEAEVRRARRASAAEYSRVADHVEQGELARALEASCNMYSAEEQRRFTQRVEDDREEQQLMARAIEASFQDQRGSDVEFRRQLEEATQASLSTATSTNGRGGSTSSSHGARSSTRFSPTSVPNTVARDVSDSAVGHRVADGRTAGGNAAVATASKDAIPAASHTSATVVPARGARPTSGSFSRGAAAAGAPAIAPRPAPAAKPRLAGVAQSTGVAVPSGVRTAAAGATSLGARSSGTALAPSPVRASGAPALSMEPRQQRKGAPVPPSTSDSGTASASAASASSRVPARPTAASSLADGGAAGGGSAAVAMGRRSTQQPLRPVVAARTGPTAPGQAAAAFEAETADRRRREADEAQRQAALNAEMAMARENERRRREEAASRAAEQHEREAEEARRREEERQRLLRQRQQEAVARAERERVAASEAARAEQRQAEANAAAAAAATAAAEQARARAMAAAAAAAAAEEEELRRERAEAAEKEAAAARDAAALGAAEQKEQDEVTKALLDLRKRYIEVDREGLKTCLQTLRTYIGNLAKSPQETKFQRIKLDNAAFKSRVARLEGATAILGACGFVEEESAWVADPSFLKTKGPRLWDALAKIDVIIGQA
eukprot:TRINITY_DN49514_c0_g1_i1.p1 TRINITY_DN49514_c0_g1~~TRINITY_DN49514_c0_g1_i1.p1  ORF type:complete len:770 (+),score=183.43 TRINITY_DN49514_c0_g1_i1:130-2439(+)